MSVDQTSLDTALVADREQWKDGPPKPDTEKSKVEKADLLLDLGEKRIIYGLACHPKFTENGFFYVTWIPDPSKETPTGTRTLMANLFWSSEGVVSPKSLRPSPAT